MTKLLLFIFSMVLTLAEASSHREGVKLKYEVGHELPGEKLTLLFPQKANTSNSDGTITYRTYLDESEFALNVVLLDAPTSAACYFNELHDFYNRGYKELQSFTLAAMNGYPSVEFKAYDFTTRKKTRGIAIVTNNARYLATYTYDHDPNELGDAFVSSVKVKN